MYKLIVITMLSVAGLCLAPMQALAYIGPGAGLTAFGTVIAVICAIALGIAGFLWYPIKRFLAKRKQAYSKTDSE